MHRPATEYIDWVYASINITRKWLDACPLSALINYNYSSGVQYRTFTVKCWTTSFIHLKTKRKVYRYISFTYAVFNPLESEGNYSATLNNMKFVHWPLMGELLHLVQREDWAGWGSQPAQAPPRCTKCNSPFINGQCTNHRIAV